MAEVKKRKRKPSEKQVRTFQHMNKAISMREAMLAGGYSEATSSHPGAKLVASKGFKTLVEEYRGHLVHAGITPEILAEIQADGLFEQDGDLRLKYLKETKKDFQIFQPDNQPANVIIGILPKKDYEY